MSLQTKTLLRIGYLMQEGVPDLNIVSGPQLHITNVIKVLERLGHQVRTVAINNKEIVWSDDLSSWNRTECGICQSPMFRLIESPIRRLQYELRFPYINLFESLRFASACLQPLEGFDLIYERHGYMGYGGLIAARRLGIPHILELNGNIVKEIDIMDLAMTPAQRNLGRMITKYSFKKTDHIVAVSAALKRELVNTFDVAENDVSVVLNGVNFDLFKQDFDKNQVRKAFAITAKPVIVFVGSFQPWHGVELLVRPMRCPAANSRVPVVVDWGWSGTKDVESLIAKS